MNLQAASLKLSSEECQQLEAAASSVSDHLFVLYA